MEKIKMIFESYGFNLNKSQYEKLDIYFKYLVQVNETMNLTAITDLEGVYIKHFLDSFCVSKCSDLNNKFLCDVGSGAGFPSIPLKIMIESLDVTIVDALNKRIEFLRNLSEKLNISINLIHNRAEIFCETHREKFDVVCARAVARLNVLDELCLPLVKKGGFFLAMKSSIYLEELKEAEKGLKILGAEVDNVFEYNLNYEGNCEYRNVIVIKKIKSCDTKYPRDFAKIKKNPL